METTAPNTLASGCNITMDETEMETELKTPMQPGANPSPAWSTNVFDVTIPEGRDLLATLLPRAVDAVISNPGAKGSSI